MGLLDAASDALNDAGSAISKLTGGSGGGALDKLKAADAILTDSDKAYGAGANTDKDTIKGIADRRGSVANKFVKSAAASNFSIVDPQDWYRMFPYQFKIMFRRNKRTEAIFYTLPLPPEALQVKMAVASDATPTMGGIVEETSQNKIWHITLSGTTGTAVSRGDDDAAAPASAFRHHISTTGLLTGLLAEANSVASRFVNTANGVLGNLTNPGGMLADLAAGILQTSLPYASSAVNGKNNGYVEIHRLHRWLYLYSALAEKNPSGTALYFMNWKDNQVWRIVVRDFTVVKNANEPFTYRYRMQLKGWEPAAVGGNADLQVDRFKTDLKSVNTVTISQAYYGVKSTITSFSKGKLPGTWK